jgi:2-hydroxy-3-keto-5-methylthiopentenyl-1-phosphate phosphatase
MEGLIPKFKACGLYDFMGQRPDFSEMAVKQFLTTAEIDVEEQLIIWMTRFKSYVATFAEFAAANNLNYDVISAGVDLYTKDIFEEYVHYMSL